MNLEQLVEWELAGEIEVLGRFSAPVPLRPQKISHDLSWGRALAAAVGSRHGLHKSFSL
jgi:hypothetical protein